LKLGDHFIVVLLLIGVAFFKRRDNPFKHFFVHLDQP
jgi:hypothetical protein